MDEEGNITSAPGSAPGVVTAMTSASAAARLAAELRATDAEAAQTEAENMRDAAVTARTEAENMKDAAVTARTEAENMRDAAVTARTEAENMKDAAVTERMAAELRATDAETAQTAAELRATDAETAQTAAELRATDAETAQTAAELRATDAETAQTEAENMKDAAVTARTEAENMKDAAVTARTEAENMKDAAVTARTEAENMKDAAVTERMAAELRATDAETAQTAAELRATDAETAQTAAELRATDAETAQTAAELRATDAETAQTEAENMKDAAVTARTEAENMKDAAVTARTEAENMKDAAVTARTEAETAQTAAELRATDAETAQTAAELRATDAETAQTAAELRATDAELRATEAENMKDVAVTAQTAAELRATEAEELARQLTMVTQIKTDLATGFDKVTPGTYALHSGGVIEIDDVRIACPATATMVPCTVVVTVNSDDKASYTSLGGVATVVNTSAVAHTRTAIGLSGAGTADENDGVLVTKTPATEVGEDGIPLNTNDDPIGVKRSPSGTTTITPVHFTADAKAMEDSMIDELEYKSVSVDRDHRITGWIGQTLTRDDSVEATEGIDAVPASDMVEATFYTNIESAEAAKLRYKAGEVPDPMDDDTKVFAVDRGQDADDYADVFTGSYIRASDGSRIRGTFTCSADPCTVIEVDSITASGEGNLVLRIHLATGWTFVSDVNVPEGQINDTHYMYFGYWLKSPVVANESPDSYQFTTYVGGNDIFTVDETIRDESHALTAKYEGGAAGKYVTRDLRVKNGIVDLNSPGSHGRFTAKAALTATFGTHPSFAPSADGITPVVEDRQNMIQGTISDFKDGSIDLGFEVTLGVRPIETSIGGIDNMQDGMVTAKFGQASDNGLTTGTWTGEFYGANAVTSDTNPNLAAVNRTLPSGVAGEFEVGTNTGYTRVVGAFAAVRTQ